MGNTYELLRCFLLLVLVSCLLGMSACVPAVAEGKSFDIPAQPAASALNEFARQADVTLIFSYDLVAGQRTRSLQGDFTVDNGLTRLLSGTSLGYQQAMDGTYLICLSSSCERRPVVEPGAPEATGGTNNTRGNGGNKSRARLSRRAGDPAGNVKLSLGRECNHASPSCNEQPATP